jgi:hypothetical protein
MLTKNNRPSMKISHEFVTVMPPKGSLKENTVYISLEYGIVLHKCACGCGLEINTPLTPRDWNLTFNGESISLWPSVGNWSNPCRSHYVIKNGWVHWSDDWTDAKIKNAREEERARRQNGTSEKKVNISKNNGSEWFV